jgi:hypothetical protein
MSNYTPGPWRVKPNSVGGPTVGPEGSVVADIRTYGGPHVGGRQHPQTDANARLIAAAPDLLEALRCACNYIDKLGGTSSPYRALLALATGEQS